MAAPSTRGPEFDAAMKALKDRGKPGGILRTWYCPECSAAAGKPMYRVETGREGCSACVHYVARVGLSY